MGIGVFAIGQGQDDEVGGFSARQRAYLLPQTEELSPNGDDGIHKPEAG